MVQCLAMTFLDLAIWQKKTDAQRTRRFPWLLAVKHARLRASPHGFLRGSAPLFDRLLADLKLGQLASPKSWIVGDMHLENVGAYRADDESVVFDLNDFDGARIGPVVHDVLRLLTSVLLTGRAFALNGPRVIHLGKVALDAWQSACASGRVQPPSEAIRMIKSQAEQSPFSGYLDARAPEKHGVRHFVRGERYHAMTAPWGTRAKSLLREYERALGDRAPAHGYTLADAALRVAGTGSLGVARIAYVVRTKDDTYRLVELKEAEGDPRQVVAGAHALVAAPPRGMAATRRFVGRRLEPQQQKLNLMTLPRDELEPSILHIAGLVGRAHRRAATKSLARFSKKQHAQILAHALSLAGMHEAIYLAYCSL
jgi:uncharacterized protein (DUF2252 family)